MKKAVDKNEDQWYPLEAVSEAVIKNRKAEGKAGAMKETVSRKLTGSDYRLKAK